jgi:hypothetical protein
MGEYAIGNCRSCGARVIWAETPSGKAQPIDAEPNARGSVFLRPQDDPRQPPVVQPLSKLAGIERRMAIAFMPHHATCPQAAQWKGARR